MRSLLTLLAVGSLLLSACGSGGTVHVDAGDAPVSRSLLGTWHMDITSGPGAPGQVDMTFSGEERGGALRLETLAAAAGMPSCVARGTSIGTWALRDPDFVDITYTSIEAVVSGCPSGNGPRAVDPAEVTRANASAVNTTYSLEGSTLTLTSVAGAPLVLRRR